METTATAGGRKFFLFYDIFANSQNILCRCFWLYL